MNKNLIVSTSIGFLLLIFFTINGISEKLFTGIYADLTEEGLYTISDGSKKIVSKLTNPITLKFYYSKSEGDSLPLVKLYGARVADLLREYSRASNGEINVQIIDPLPDSEDEEWAEKYGLRAMNLPSGQKLFLGLVAINGLGEEALIPLFDVRRQEYLEYDITKLIYTLEDEDRPKVGILSPLDIAGAVKIPSQLIGQPPRGSKPWVFVQQLSKLFEVESLPLELEVIPEDINLLVLVHPRGFSEKLLYAIDQFVMRGGNIMLAVDPFSMSDMPEPDPQNPMVNFTHNRSSDLNFLTSKWGFKLIEGRVVTDRYLATPVNTPEGGQANFIAWLSMMNGMDYGVSDPIIGEDVVTSNLENIMFAWSGAFEFSELKNNEITQTTLLRTTTDAMLMEEKNIRFSAEKPNALLEQHVPGGKQLPLAIKVSGVFESNFDSIPETVNQDLKDRHLKTAKGSPSIVAFSDVDFLANDYGVMVQNLFGTEIISLLNDNQSLALNAVDNLGGSADLIALRSRGQFTRPFTKVQKIEAEAQDKYKDVEKSFQAALDRANERLSRLQSGIKEDSKSAVMNEALVEEIKKLREDKRSAQSSLREVRLALRQDKENLGTRLFLINTFLLPSILLFSYFFFSYLRNNKKS